MSLKFRVWDPASKVMHREDVAVSSTSVFLTGSGAVTEILGAYVMPFTGRSDMDGIEIYEGDVVDYPLYREDPFYARIRGVIKNKNGKWVISSRTGMKNEFANEIGLSDVSSVTVAGNIYENPKLLSY